MTRRLHAVLCGALGCLLATMVLAGCGPSKPACTPEQLAALEAAYVAEALAACRGFDYDTCPTLPALRVKYEAKRGAWIRCEP